MMIRPVSSASAPSAEVLDRKQFDAMLRGILPSLTRYALSLARNRDLSEDLVQEAVSKAWRSHTKFIIGTNFKAWLYRILKNCFISHVRRHRVSKTDTYGDDLPEVPVASNQEAGIFLKDVWRYWAKLTPSQQRAIRLVAIDGHSYEEAASLEEISIGTLKSRVSRGRQTLLALLNGNVVASIGKSEDVVSEKEPAQHISERSTNSVDDADRTQVEMLRAWRSHRAAIPAKAA